MRPAAHRSDDADRWAQAGRLEALIRDVPDYPEPGIVFKDITPLLADPDAFDLAIRALTEPWSSGENVGIDKVAGIEARGFILAAPVALALGAGFVPVRKQGKLPAETRSRAFTLEYGEAVLEVHADAIVPGERVLVVDDVLATGGTIEAAVGLVGDAGAEVLGAAVLIELGFLSGRDRLPGTRVEAVLTV